MRETLQALCLRWTDTADAGGLDDFYGLQAANDRAAAAGVRAGMALADARAVCPPLATRSADLHADEKMLDALARWAERYSPRVALDAPDGLWLDMTGGAHLFGGECALAGTVIRTLEGLGVRARLALADIGPASPPP